MYQDYKENRKTHLVNYIKRDKSTIAKDTAIAAGTALMVGAGALGTFHFGPEFFKMISSNEALTIKSKFFFDLKVAGFEISAIAAIGGITSFVAKIKDIVKNIKGLVSAKKEINSIEEIQKGRSM